LDILRENTDDFTERPLFKDWSFKGAKAIPFYCPFINVDASKFPNSGEERWRSEIMDTESVKSEKKD